ncbi:sensor domain-containing diguanylate cyclase [Pseudoduganella albidiflava]|uniref:sensor domain-containing diguanylate cyclase n=1 Tax=Pseudoduganella albidiflava TaxID=321983 RepID=UPI001E29FAA0|nr:diguanylate cyclase [Pseudoduganella albidiflava]
MHHLIDGSRSGQPDGDAFRLLELLAIPAFVLDARGRAVAWNRACERLTGVPASDVLGTTDTWRCFHRTPHPTLADLVVQQRTHEAPALYDAHAQPCEEPGHLSAEGWCDMPRGGRRRYLAVDVSPICNELGGLAAVVQTLRDMTEEKQAQIALEQLATRDALTGLANRRCFDDTLHAEWQRALRQQQPLSLLMVDVDNFKQYNDAYGHVGGDDCLRRVAGAVAKEMRANDLVARYGGEEFAVILPNQSLKGAAIVAERMRCRVEQLHLPNLGAAGQCVTISIGAATALPAPEYEPVQLLAEADAALYRAKHMGRNRISLPLEMASAH